jgi:putative sterol carrier protein
MDDATAQFFEGLAQRETEPVIAKFSGSVLFNVTDKGQTEHWRLAFDKGKMSISHDVGEADCTISGDRAVFDRVSRGEGNAMAAVLRGALVCSGDVELLLAIQRIFPGPPAASGEPS